MLRDECVKPRRIQRTQTLIEQLTGSYHLSCAESFSKDLIETVKAEYLKNRSHI